MIDTIELEARIKCAGLTKKDVASALNIAPMSMIRKSKNRTEFKASEIKKLAEILKIDQPDEFQRIFFS